MKVYVVLDDNDKFIAIFKRKKDALDYISEYENSSYVIKKDFVL